MKTRVTRKRKPRLVRDGSKKLKLLRLFDSELELVIVVLSEPIVPSILSVKDLRLICFVYILEEGFVHKFCSLRREGFGESERALMA